ncbi:hypothetical protein CDL15_Pgr025412 [Punica granatum]|uniref:Uncharacterized protein n=1 Tax=Punica granatum TaxID=22663 RepID=A0A218W8V9_PUNGR|nr:hypothetical protein CDL15_Pgr025412 [Punica granatum]
MKRCFSTVRTPLNGQTSLPLLDSCKSINHVWQVHAQMVVSSHILSPVSANKLLKLLTESSFGSLSYAQQVFDRIPGRNRDVFLYNTMIKAHSLTNGSANNAVLLFRSMLRNCPFGPNRYTFVFLFRACGNSLGVCDGEQVRAHGIKAGLEGNLFVTNALIGMYADWGLVDEARRVFDWSLSRDMFSWNIMASGYVRSGKLDEAKEFFEQMPERDVVSWSSVISGYVQAGCFLEALDLFHEMLRSGAKPNQFTLDMRECFIHWIVNFRVAAFLCHTVLTGMVSLRSSRML